MTSLLLAFSVSVSPGASVVETNAATELQTFLGKRLSDGTVLTVDGTDKVVFHVGDTDFAKVKGLSSEGFKDEEWVVRSYGGDIVLNGGGRGVLYAVWHFLEDDCGLGFFGNDDTEIPSGSLALGKLDRRGRPHFRWRNIYRGGPLEKCHPDYAARRRINTNNEHPIPPAFGGDEMFGPPYIVHTYNWYFPKDRYFAQHPEYYALRNGKRFPGPGGQLCLSNPDVRRLLKEKLLAYIAQGEEKARATGQRLPLFYDLSMNDNWNLCECEACKAECEKYNPSGQQIRLMNELAEAIRDRYPHVCLKTIAYFYTEPAPKGGVKAAKNVCVGLCDTRTNSASSIREDEHAVFRDLVESWRTCCDRIVIEDYAVIYDERTRSFPFPSEKYFADHFRYMAEQNVFGFFIEQEYCDIADQHELKYYLQSQLMEDPSADVKALYRTFMTRYYGPAAKFVGAARKRLAEAREQRHAFIGWLANVGAFDFLTEADTAYMRACYDEAEKAVSADAKRLARVKKSRRGVDDLSEIQAKAPKPDARGVLVLEGDLISNMTPSVVSAVDDPEYPCGKAMRCDVDAEPNRYFHPPLTWGLWDVATDKGMGSGAIEISSKHGYQWYDLGEQTFPGSGYMYFTRRWSVQICPAFPGIAGKRFRIRALIRCAGPVFHSDETGKSWIDFARFELTPVTNDTKPNT